MYLDVDAAYFVSSTFRCFTSLVKKSSMSRNIWIECVLISKADELEIATAMLHSRLSPGLLGRGDNLWSLLVSLLPYNTFVSHTFGKNIIQQYKIMHKSGIWTKWLIISQQSERLCYHETPVQSRYIVLRCPALCQKLVVYRYSTSISVQPLLYSILPISQCQRPW